MKPKICKNLVTIETCFCSVKSSTDVVDWHPFLLRSKIIIDLSKWNFLSSLCWLSGFMLASNAPARSFTTQFSPGWQEQCSKFITAPGDLLFGRTVQVQVTVHLRWCLYVVIFQVFRFPTVNEHELSVSEIMSESKLSFVFPITIM